MEVGRHPLTARGAGRHPSNDRGFTLIELLIVIVILGILAVVVVMAVRGIRDEGEENACGVEFRTVATAVEAYSARFNDVPDEASLVSVAHLRMESSRFDVTPDGSGGYSISPEAGSSCPQSSTVAGPAAAAAPPPPPPPPVAPTSVSFGRYTGYQYGATGADEILVLGGAEGEADFIAAITADPGSSRRVTFLNIGLIQDDEDIDYILSRSRSNGITDVAIYLDDDVNTIDNLATAGTWPSVHAYLSTVVAPDPYHQLDASGPTLESLLVAIG